MQRSDSWYMQKCLANKEILILSELPSLNVPAVNTPVPELNLSGIKIFSQNIFIPERLTVKCFRILV